MSSIGKAAEALRRKAQQWLESQKLFGTDFWGYLGNGAQELQSVFVPNASHVQLGTNPVYGVVTTGQVTAERLEGKDVHGREPGKEPKQPEMDKE